MLSADYCLRRALAQGQRGPLPRQDAPVPPALSVIGVANAFRWLVKAEGLELLELTPDTAKVLGCHSVRPKEPLGEAEQARTPSPMSLAAARLRKGRSRRAWIWS